MPVAFPSASRPLRPLRLCAAAFLTVLVALPGLALAADVLTPEDVTGPEAWGSLEGVMRVRHLALAAQPDADALAVAREKGAVAVVNLRAPSEQEGLGFDEQRVVQALGMTYTQVPVAGPEPYDAATLAAIEAAVAAHEGELVLVHCSSGNRAAGWLALHLVEGHGMDLAPSLEVARRAGLRSPELEAKVREAAASLGRGEGSKQLQP